MSGRKMICLVGGPWDGRHISVERLDPAIQLSSTYRVLEKTNTRHLDEEQPLETKIESSIYTRRNITCDNRKVFYYAIEEMTDLQALFLLLDGYQSRD